MNVHGPDARAGADVQDSLQGKMSGQDHGDLGGSDLGVVSDGREIELVIQHLGDPVVPGAAMLASVRQCRWRDSRNVESFKMLVVVWGPVADSA